MNVLYLVPSVSSSAKGILKKQYDKINAFEKAGCEVKAILFSYEKHKDQIENKLQYYFIDLEKVKRKYSKRLIWRILPVISNKAAQKFIYDKVCNQLDGIDIAYVRYSSADYFALPLFNRIKKLGIKIILEYNGIHMYDEVVRRKNEQGPFSLYLYLNEKYLEKKVAGFADVIVGVTKEITNYYADLNQTKIRYTLSNGVETSRFKQRNAPVYSKKEVSFLFLSGSRNYWHGIDRFLKGLQIYKGNVCIKLTIAGPVYEEYMHYSYPNPNIDVQFISAVDGPELDRLFDIHHIGIGSLALHRMRLKEASVLKVREYIARGIPFIIGYEDTDLEGVVKFSPYYFKVTANEEPVDIELILKFCDNVLGIENYCEKLKEIGHPLVEYQPKINQLVEVFKKLN